MLSNIGIPSLIIILVIVLLIFGTKRLRNMGGDLGGAFRNFKSSMKDGEDDQASSPTPTQSVTRDPDEVEATVVDSKTENNR